MSETITGYNLLIRKSDRPMTVTGIFRHVGKNNDRYRLAGIDNGEGGFDANMSIFCTEERAKSVAILLNLEIQTVVQKTEQNDDDINFISFNGEKLIITQQFWFPSSFINIDVKLSCEQMEKIISMLTQEQLQLINQSL